MLFFNWLKSGRKPEDKGSQGLLGRLRRDQSGATLAMMAAAVIPMVGIVGSAVDISRAYLVKTRLQQACDAGALAARRVMTGSALDDDAETEGENFFNINLAQGAYGAENIEFELSDVLQGGKTVGLVQGDASADVPTTLMRLFGSDTIAMTATCEAQLNVANNDIMFVLDVTGSMACLPSDAAATCSAYAASNIIQTAGGLWGTTEKTNSRIDGLRAAVKDFFSTVRTATSSSARLRVGFVPYSSGVRMGPVLSGLSNSISSGSIEYQSRLANFTTATAPIGTEGQTTTSKEVFKMGSTETSITQAHCNNYAANQVFSRTSNPKYSFSKSPTSGGGPAPATTYEYEYSTPEWGYSGSGTTSGTYRKCRRTVRTTPTTYVIRYKLTDFTYTNVSYPVGTFAGGSSVSLVTLRGLNDATLKTLEVPTSGSYTAQQLAAFVAAGTATNMTAQNFSWDGCIEERLTGMSDVDSAPNSQATRWRPSWPSLVYNRTNSPSYGTRAQNGANPYFPASPENYNTNYSCPKAATRLAVMTQAQVDAYVDGADFLAHGQTYHDIGMLWGVRLMSPNGMFSVDHGAAPNGKPVNRHIIFMTDGAMEPSTEAYSTYGIEQLDRRVMPTGSDLVAAHNTRFLAFCQAAKDRGISVWTVSFATALTTQLTNCADSNQSFAATSSADLQSKFQTIAQRIAELRLSR